MKVLYVGGFELPDKNAAALRVLSNAKLLREGGCEVTLVGVDKNRERGIRLEDTRFTYDGFTCFNMRYPSSSVEWLRFLCSVSFLKYIGKTAFPDVVIAYNYPAPALYRLKRWCKKNRVKLMADCTEWYGPQGKGFYRLIKQLDTSIRMKLIHPRLDGMVTVSRFLYQYYKKRMERVFMLPPLVDKQQDKWIFKNHPSGDNVLKLVYAGSPGGWKDKLDVIIKALSGIRKRFSIKVKLLVIGITHEQYRELYGQDLPEQHLFVEFKGRIPHREVLQYVHDSDYQIFIRENNRTNTAGFPSKLVESLTCGTPIITNKIKYIDEYLKNGINGYFVDSEDEKSLIETLSVPLRLSRTEIDILKKNCEKTYFFNYKTYVDSFRDFIRRCASDEHVMSERGAQKNGFPEVVFCGSR